MSLKASSNRPLRSARTIHDLGMRIPRQRYIHYSSKDCKANKITVHGCVSTRFRYRKSFSPVYPSNTCSRRYRQSRMASSDCRQSPMHGSLARSGTAAGRSRPRLLRTCARKACKDQAILGVGAFSTSWRTAMGYLPLPATGDVAAQLARGHHLWTTVLGIRSPMMPKRYPARLEDQGIKGI